MACICLSLLKTPIELLKPFLIIMDCEANSNVLYNSEDIE